jgi:hypothetical protein
MMNFIPRKLKSGDLRGPQFLEVEFYGVIVTALIFFGESLADLPPNTECR